MSEVSSGEARRRDKPWIIRTYAGHSTAKASNALYRNNLAKGQTGLSVAFDLPTQTGYDADHPLAEGEVGKVGVSICHLGDMRALFEGIPLASMNTSMTINATAAWLLALYIAVADEQGAAHKDLQGTTQNDIIKEYLSRGTYVFPPGPSMRLTTDVIRLRDPGNAEMEPDERVFLPSAGGGRDADAGARLRARDCDRGARCGEGRGRRGRRGSSARWSAASRSSSMPACASSPNCARCAPLPSCGTRSRRRAIGVTDAKQRLFRYGVQVNSLGLTEQQPENNVYRILIEMLAVTLSKQTPRARRAAAGLERGARPAAAVGPAMVAAHAADPRLRDRPPGIRRHLRRARPRSRPRSRRSRARPARSWITSSAWAARSPRSRAAT